MIKTNKTGKLALTGIAFALAGGLLAGCAPTAQAEPQEVETVEVDHSAMHAEQNANMEAQSQLYAGMRTLWADHMYWTYITVDNFFNNQDALGDSLARLLQNQVDIGDAVKGVYGDEGGAALTELLTEHIELAVPVLTAANPDFWPTEATSEMMKGHIDTTVTYAVDLLQKDYENAIADFTVAYDHMMEMSDALASGIIAQFPESF